MDLRWLVVSAIIVDNGGKIMVRPIEGDTATIWFPNMTVNVEKCEEYGVNPGDIPHSYDAEYDGITWHASIHQADEYVHGDTLHELAKEIQRWMKDDMCIEKAGGVQYKMDKR